MAPTLTAHKMAASEPANVLPVQLQKDKMAGDTVKEQTWVVSAAALSLEEGAVVGIAYDGEAYPATLSFYTEASGDE